MSTDDEYPDAVRRDGFTSDRGYFRTAAGNMTPVDPDKLKKMFLPKVTSAGKKALKNPDFVRAQLKHYGVEFDESDISGDGLEYLKTSIEAGKLDTIPANILELQADMHQEWIEKCTVEHLKSKPHWLLEKYFLSNGVPDRTKTTTVVAVPFPKACRRLPRLMEEAARQIPGLQIHQAFGFFTRTVIMAWDETAVKKESETIYVAELRALKDERAAARGLAPNRDEEQQKAHQDYLDSLGPKTTGFTPVGSYIVRIELLEEIVKHEDDPFMIDIYETETPGLYQVDFDFSMFKGIMMMSSDKRALEEFEDPVSSGPRSGDGSVPANELKTSPTTKGLQRGQKQKKASKHLPLTFQFKQRCYEPRGERLFFVPRPGTIQFGDRRFFTFTGQMVFHFSGKEVVFTGCKVGENPPPTKNDWEDYKGKEGERELPSYHRGILAKMGYK
ncbi:hypothetical protein N7540_011350 [Penicillium herquei]|nr:hypothetical protein N7540_011350 [Penicillium herquei]